MATPELFDCPPFLERKLGSKPFDDIPQKPGIYRFYDEYEVLLYVGKAKNLRRRLFTYKRAKPGRTSRKEAALISRIHRFEFDVTNSEQEAFLQENRWIREYRPEFNHANKHTETYYFITIRETRSGLMFGLSMNPSGSLYPAKERPLYRETSPPFSDKDDADVKIYGCFKGHQPVRRSLGALLQLLWMAEHQLISPHFLPVQLSRNLTPLRFHLPIQDQAFLVTDELIPMLDDWFLGVSPDLVFFLIEKISESDHSVFNKNFLKESAELLLTYFQRSLVRYRMIRDMSPDRKSQLIQQDELDDLITKFNKASPFYHVEDSLLRLSSYLSEDAPEPKEEKRSGSS